MSAQRTGTPPLSFALVVGLAVALVVTIADRATAAPFRAGSWNGRHPRQHEPLQRRDVPGSRGSLDRSARGCGGGRSRWHPD
jgi:hypothetical protein